MLRSFNILISALILLVSQMAVADAQEIRIGMSLPLSGPAQKLARQYEFGARLALENHNTEAGNKASLYISDDGCGFDPSDIRPDRIGMGIMRERAESVGAVLEIDSQPGSGTQVKVTWPDMRGEAT